MTAQKKTQRTDRSLRPVVFDLKPLLRCHTARRWLVEIEKAELTSDRQLARAKSQHQGQLSVHLRHRRGPDLPANAANPVVGNNLSLSLSLQAWWSAVAIHDRRVISCLAGFTSTTSLLSLMVPLSGRQVCADCKQSQSDKKSEWQCRT